MGRSMTALFRWLRSLIEPAIVAGLLLATASCVTGPEIDPPPTTASEEQAYRAFYPTYAEICAVSQLGKKPGFGAELSSGFGGHAVLYLNGVCRKQDVDYPVLVMCDENKNPSDGVGLSVNEHYKNAEWVATEGRDFFFDGGLKPGEPVTKDAYRATQARAQAKGIFTGVTFHQRARLGRQAAVIQQQPARGGVVIERLQIVDRHVVGSSHQIDELVLRHREIEQRDQDEPVGRPFVPDVGRGQRVMIQMRAIMLE